MKSVLVLILFIGNIAYSQNDSKEIIISGYVNPAITAHYSTSELIVRKKETTNRNSLGEVHKVAIMENGYFKVRIPSTEKLFYVSFEFENKKDDNWKGRFYNAGFPRSQSLREVYLFQTGDSINVNIEKEGNIFFSGRGSEKLNCEWQIYNIEPLQQSFQGRSVSLQNQGKLVEMLDLTDKAISYSIMMRTTILESYTSQLSKEIYELIYLDAIASVQHHVYYQFQNLLRSFPEDADKTFLKDYYNELVKKNKHLKAESIALDRSAYYADMLFEMELDSVRLHSINYSDSKESAKVYRNIVKKYQGDLKDKLLYIYFELYGKLHSVEAKELIGDALSVMHNAKYKLLLDSWRQKNFSVFPFELVDANGKVHKLSEYQGKVLVMDFWFTGCGPCLRLADAMDTIVQKYKDNKDIVFVSVSTDSKDVWAKSVASGMYTSEGMINLFTNGKGFAHPLIRHYNFHGFPQQLVIGKTGQLITSSPPRSDVSDSNKKEFIKILNDQLTSN